MNVLGTKSGALQIGTQNEWNYYRLSPEKNCTRTAKVRNPVIPKYKYIFKIIVYGMRNI
jgi:hypothetical protein